MTLEVVARIHNGFTSKFGLPRQSGLAASLMSEIVFEPEFRNPDFLRGIEEYSHLWLIWGFSESGASRSPTVRPPRLGGNTRVGVFATRSPFRPNPLGLTCVKLESVRRGEREGTVLVVSGADIMDGSPIYDIKPYIPYADSYPEASGSFSERGRSHRLNVDFPQEQIEKIPSDARPALLEALESDPRPAYQDDPERIYGMSYAGFNICFTVNGKSLTVRETEREGTTDFSSHRQS